MYASQFRTNPEKKIGAKAQATALKFQDGLLTALERHSWSTLGVNTVARLSGYAPATFYQYYPSLDDLAYATAERLALQDQPVPKHLALVMNLLMFEIHEGLFTPSDGSPSAPAAADSPSDSPAA